MAKCIEGKLKKIRKIRSSEEGIRTYLTIMDKKNSKHKIKFPGIVYPDSIGNKVKFIGDAEIMGSLTTLYSLEDIKLKRKYLGEK